LQDAAEQAKAISKALATESEKRAKMWATVSGIVVFIISNSRIILGWISKLLGSTT